MKRLFYALIVCVSVGISHAQSNDPRTLFGGVPISISPSLYLNNVLGTVDWAILREQPPLEFEGIWGADGPIVTGLGPFRLGAARTGGGFSVGANLKIAGTPLGVGIDGGTNVSYTVTYQIAWTKIEDGYYLLQLIWTKTGITGSKASGVVTVGTVRKGQPGLIESRLIG